MAIEQFIRHMPKVELHIHLEGSIRPETLIKLADRNKINLPISSLNELKRWYQFSDFNHFLEIYSAISNCIRTPDDFEIIATEFVKQQVEQNILYSELIFTPYTHHEHVVFEEQLAAINHVRLKAERDFGVFIGLVPDISRHMRPITETFQIADWAIENMDNGIIALGLGGPEIGNPPEIFQKTFDKLKPSGLPSLPHAGETVGPASIWGAINALSAFRIGHGIRCLEDPELVAYLRENQIALDVCPTSNVCLGLVPTLAEHPLPKLLEEGLLITINSDDPPMFDTTLTDEYLHIVKTFKFDLRQIKQFVLNGVRASLLSLDKKHVLEQQIIEQFIELESDLRI